MIGRRISRFRILELLGRGGMASVWRARDEMLGRDVAVKVLDEALASTVWARHRFRREAEIAALLEHPAIVPVFDAGESDGFAYLVMKLVEGETLAQRLTRRLPPVEEVLQLASATLDALAYAHAQRVVHRDVSPRNIMFTPDGRIYILDFGLARVTGRGDTTSGLLVGTPAYIAPETLRGDGVDARGDLYGLGVVLYEAFTGSLPFRGENTAALQFQSLHGTVDAPSRLRPELGPGIDAFVLRMMARDRDDRFASARDASLELARLTATPESGTTHRPTADPGGASNARVQPEDPIAGGIGSPVDRPSGGPGGFAEPYSTGQAHGYVAVLPMDYPAEDGVGHLELVRALETAMRTGLAGLKQIHVVDAGREAAADEDARELARRLGANLVLRSSVRFAGTVARVSFSLIDPARRLQLAGGTVEGSTLLGFELEDRLVDSVRSALELDPAMTPRWRPASSDPAAGERFEQALAGLRRFDQESSLDHAIRLLEGLLESEGESAVVLATLARAHVAKYRLTAQRIWETQAANACGRAAHIEPESPDVALAVADLDVAMGRNAEALEQLDRATAVRPEDYDTLLVRCSALVGLGRWEEAERNCLRAIQMRPEDWRGFHAMGLAYFRQARYEEALSPWRNVIALAPDNAGAHRNLGSSYFRLNRFDRAIEAYRRSIDIRPNSMALYNLGVSLFYLERWEESVAAFERAVALNPSDPMALGNLGNACRWVPGMQERMQETLERAAGLLRERLDREPGSGAEWGTLSGWLANLGRVEEAEQAAHRAIEMSPDDAACLAQVGHTLLAIGQRTEALRFLRGALDRGYGAEALRRSPDLRALEGANDYERMIAESSRSSDGNEVP